MLRYLVWGLVLCARAGSAQGGPMDPEVPRDPPAVRSAQQGLYADWRACRVAAYPKDAEAGVEKMSSTVELKRVGRKVRGTLTIGYHKLDGTEVAASADQAAFAACVKRRFEKRRFHAPTGSRIGTRWALANPFPGYRVVDRSELGQRPAADYVLYRLAEARATCGVSNARRGIKAVVDTNADGSVGSVAINGIEQAYGTCLRRQLQKTLRFPAVNQANQVAVTN